MRKVIAYLIAGAIILTACGNNRINTDNETKSTNQEKSSAQNVDTSDTVINNTIISREELKQFTFDSDDFVEAISNEDLIYIAQNEYSTSNFIPELKEREIDLFGVPLWEKEIEGTLYKESIDTYIFQYPVLLEEVNVNESISKEEFQKYIDEHNKNMIESANTWDGDTGCKTQDEEIIYCGENDYYVEYSIRFTELRTMYNNDVLVTKQIPRAYRRCFFKNEFSISSGKQTGLVWLGELTLENVKNEMDISVMLDNIPSVYRKIEETDKAYIYTNYVIYTVGGDYSLFDTAKLVKQEHIIDKETHETSCTETQIKSVEIEGTDDNNCFDEQE